MPVALVNAKHLSDRGQEREKVMQVYGVHQTAQQEGVDIPRIIRRFVQGSAQEAMKPGQLSIPQQAQRLAL